MRIIALLLLLFGFSEVALAQTPECKSTRAADLLACYENGAPPLAAIKHPAPKTATASHKPAASKAPADQEQVVFSGSRKLQIRREAKNYLPGMLAVSESPN